ncbi:MAG: helix-turn-helix transcriptional regulator [Magnetococcales bacterium]|nr:helix-turn-helix transcriptional regulator [Magnetococcales bacterium]
MDTYEIRKENLVRLLEERFGGVKKAMADATKMSPSLFHAYATEKQVGPKVARRIEEAVDLPHGWMDQPHGGKGYAPEIDAVSVPVFDVEASAGHGGWVESEEIVKELMFRRDWLQSHGYSKKNLGVIRARGDSMMPTIPDGAALLIHNAETDIQNGKVYVLRYDGMLHVKRLQRLPGHLIQVVSDNASEYPPFTVELNDGVDFQVLGRVVWLGREM